MEYYIPSYFLTSDTWFLCIFCGYFHCSDGAQRKTLLKLMFISFKEFLTQSALNPEKTNSWKLLQKLVAHFLLPLPQC